MHHVVRLDEHEQALRDGARSAYEVRSSVWGGTLGFHEQRFALAEALAHIERLERLGRAVEVEPNRWPRRRTRGRTARRTCARR